MYEINILDPWETCPSPQGGPAKQLNIHRMKWFMVGQNIGFSTE